MVSTRSGRVASATPAEALISDGQVEVKSTRRPRTSRKKAEVEATSVLENMASQQPQQDEQLQQEPEPEESPIQEAFKVVTVVTPKSIKSTPGSNASPAVSRFLLPASNAKTDRGAVRRLSMNEVQDAAQVPLPYLDTASDEPPLESVDPRCKTSSALAHRKRSHTLGPGAFLIHLIALPIVLMITYSLLCQKPHNTTIPSQWLSTAQPSCARVDSVLADASTWLHAEASRPGAPLAHVATVLGNAQTTAGALLSQAQYRGNQAIQTIRDQWASVRYWEGVLDNAKTTLDSLTKDPKSFFKTLSRSNTASPVLPADVLQALLVQGPGLPHIQDIYLHHDTIQQHTHVAAKGTGILIPCGSGCEELVQTVVAGVADPKHVLVLDGSAVPGTEGAGALQTKLATFLSGSPAGVVVVTRLTDMEAPALVVLSNAMSEGGSLQLKGRPVPSTRALYLGLLPLDVHPKEEGDVLGSKVKAQLQAAFEGKSHAAGVQTAGALALALRRRFDYVVPSLTALTPEPVNVAPETQQEEVDQMEAAEQVVEEADQDVVNEEVAVEAEVA